MFDKMLTLRFTVKSIELSIERWSLLSFPKIAHATRKVVMPLKNVKVVL